MLHTIGVIEKIERRKLCIAYAYVAVSQYYYVLMEFNEVCHLFYRNIMFLYFYYKCDNLGLVMGI